MELGQLSKLTNFTPIFFVRVPPPGSRTVDTDPPDGAPGDMHVNSAPSGSQACFTDGNILTQQTSSTRNFPASSAAGAVWIDSHAGEHVSNVQEQLRRLGYLDGDPQLKQYKEYSNMDSCFVEKFTDFGAHFAVFTRKILQNFLVNASTVLNVSHTRCLNMFILSAFDMARDMLITPKKLEFAREKEDELYKSLLKISVSKLDEIKELISSTIYIIRSCLIAEAAEFQFIGEYKKKDN